MIKRLCSAAAILYLATPICSSAQQASQLKARVLAEYPAALERLERGAGQFRGSARLTLTHFRKAEKVDTTSSTLRFAISGGLRKVERVPIQPEASVDHRGESRQTEHVYCRNGTSSFSLTKSKGSSFYVLSGFSSRDDATVDEMLKMTLDQFVGAAYSVFGLPVSSMMSDPSFSIRNVTPILEGGKEHLKIEYNYRSKEFRIASGSLVVSPDEGWRIVLSENTLGLTGGKALRTEVRYDDSRGVAGIIPSHVTVNQPNAIREFELAEISVSEPPEKSEFTLPYYGMPDLERPPASSGGLSVSHVLLASLIVCGIASVAIKRYSERDQRAVLRTP